MPPGEGFYHPINCPQCGMDNVVPAGPGVLHCQTCGTTFGGTA